jgi:Fe-S cluster assembly protein SufD
MLIDMQTQQEPFWTSFTSRQDLPTDPDNLKKVRAKSWERFLSIGLPDRKNEPFHYIYPHLKMCFREQFHPAAKTGVDHLSIAEYVLPECRHSFIVFANGIFRPDLSDISALPPTVALLSLPQAMRSFTAHLSASFAKALKEESDPFALLNQAVHQEGCFLYIPPKMKVLPPVQIVHLVNDVDTCAYVMPRLHLFVASCAELTLVTTCQFFSAKNCFFNGLFDGIVDNGGYLNYIHYDVESQFSQGWLLDAFRLTLKRDARATSIQLTNNPCSKRDWKIALAGDNAHVNLNGLWVLAENQEAHTNILIDHEAPYCESLQLFKGVLADVAHSSFQGKIMVRKPAQKTQAYQLNNNLLLSVGAQANSKPGLEIFADDVKATHGATSGALDAEQLFYLQTRGLSQETAKKILVRGFCQEMVNKLSLDSLMKRAVLFLETYSPSSCNQPQDDLCHE